jgi:hypothetical protein
MILSCHDSLSAVGPAKVDAAYSSFGCVGGIPLTNIPLTFLPFQFDFNPKNDYNVYNDDGEFMSRSSIVSSRLEPEQQQRLVRKARQIGRSPSETGALLIEEALRRDEFAFIDFRDSPAGRQAHIQGSTLAIWEVVWIANGYQDDVAKTAAHLCLSPLKVKAALNYARAFPDEIQEAIQEHQACDFDSLSRMLPQAEVFPPPRNN